MHYPCLIVWELIVIILLGLVISNQIMDWCVLDRVINVSIISFLSSSPHHRNIILLISFASIKREFSERAITFLEFSSLLRHVWTAAQEVRASLSITSKGRRRRLPLLWTLKIPIKVWLLTEWTSSVDHHCIWELVINMILNRVGFNIISDYLVILVRESPWKIERGSFLRKIENYNLW